jgi:cardiolipin synthase
MAIFLSIALPIIHLLGALSAISALFSARTSQGAVAWIVSLITFPYLAVPAYWIFGRPRFHGYVFARQNKDSLLRTSVGSLLDNVRARVPALGEDYGQVRAIERLARMPFSGGNAVELLVDGRATFDSIFEGLDEAGEYILVQFYIINNDDLGRRLRDCLIRKAQAGVRVCLLYDEIGSHKLHRKFFRPLRAAGAEVREFHSSKGRGNRFQLNFRNHRKIVVVDGHTGWVGGHNVGDEYLGLNKKFGPWRDTHIKLAGPAVFGLQLSFMEDWHWATGEALDMTWTETPVHDADQHVLILPSGPADDLETASLMYQLAIHSAEQRIWIASPYFVPDEGVRDALLLAALRGVDVRILIPDRPDHLLVYLSAFAFLGPMLEAGISVYRYKPGFLHQKVFLVDDYAAGVGTANLDNRSFRLNFEVTAIMLDRTFASRIEAMFVTDFSRSHEMTTDDLKRKSKIFRLFSRIAHLLAPVQ